MIPVVCMFIIVFICRNHIQILTESTYFNRTLYYIKPHTHNTNTQNINKKKIQPDFVKTIHNQQDVRILTIIKRKK